MTFIVTEKAQRPAKMDGTCFYCGVKIGGLHKTDCVLVKKNVKIRLTVEYDVSVPAFWDKDQIEFHRNLGSWCADNSLDELQALNGCLCSYTHFEHIKDTTDKPYLEE